MAHSSLQGKRFEHAGTGIDWKLCERNWKAETTQREREELGGKIIFLGQNVQNLTFHSVPFLSVLLCLMLFPSLLCESSFPGDHLFPSICPSKLAETFPGLPRFRTMESVLRGRCPLPKEPQIKCRTALESKAQAGWKKGRGGGHREGVEEGHSSWSYWDVFP